MHMTDKPENPNAKLGVTDAHGNFDDYFGVCPTCGRNDGYINIGRGHWFYCSKHRVKWYFGSNLFSSWREQTEDEQRETYDELGFGEYTEFDEHHHEGFTARRGRPEPRDREAIQTRSAETSIPAAVGSSCDYS
jgi:hypothetical protein